MCVAVRHFARLMPLLLAWMHAAGTPELRAAAAGALEVVARGCWPRMGAHAALLRSHVQQAQQEAAAEAAEADSEGGGIAWGGTDMAGLSEALEQLDSLLGDMAAAVVAESEGADTAFPVAAAPAGVAGAPAITALG